MSITMSNIGEALKTVYLPTCRYQMNEEADEFVAELEKNDSNIEIKSAEIKFAFRYGKNGGVGNRADDGTLPTPNSRKTIQATLPTRNIFARIQFTDKVMKATKASVSSFVDVMTTEVEDAMADAKDSFARQVHGNSAGKLATCAGENSDTATQTLDNVTYLAIGMVVDVMASNGTVKYDANEIIDIDYDNKNIVFAAVPGGTTLSTDYLVVTGSAGLELTGLGELFDNTQTNIYGITRASHLWANPIVKAISGEIDELKMQEYIDITRRRTGTKVDFIITDDGTARAYQYMQQVFKRNTEYMTLKGGYDVMSYNKIPITKSKYCEAGAMYMLSKEEFKVHRLDDWDWMSQDGAVLSRVANKAAYEATLSYYGDLGCYRPGGQVKLTGITAH